jgi:hypothetical protein
MKVTLTIQFKISEIIGIINESLGELFDEYF